MRGPARATIELIEFAIELLERDHPMTLRQLHYGIFSAAVISYKNDMASYRRLSRATTDARRLYREWELVPRVSSEELETQRLACKAAEDREVLADEALERADETGKKAAIRRALDAACAASDESQRLAKKWQEIYARAIKTLKPPPRSFPHEWMVDETRKPIKWSVWENAAGFIDEMKTGYRRDYWQAQPSYCEVWSEKATILGSIRPLLSELGVTVRNCRGFGSCGQEMDIGEEFKQQTKPIQVFYLGDFDCSGDYMDEEFHQRVEKAAGIKFNMRRLAIHKADIKKFDLPPQQIKDSDPRAARFREKHGDDQATIELDALPVGELRKRVKKAIKGLIDFESWNRALEIEQAECASIARVADMVKNLPQLGSGGIQVGGH